MTSYPLSTLDMTNVRLETDNFLHIFRVTQVNNQMEFPKKSIKTLEKIRRRTDYYSQIY